MSLYIYQSIEVNLSVCSIILDVNYWLNFVNLWPLSAQQRQEEDNLGSSEGMSLKTYSANYWPGMHTTGLSVVHVNADILKTQRKDFSIFRWAAPA